MEIKEIEAILDLMRKNNVQGFEVGDLKVSFWSREAADPVDWTGERIPDDQQVDLDLGIDLED
jgi:hypothetical protein